MAAPIQSALLNIRIQEVKHLTKYFYGATLYISEMNANTREKVNITKRSPVDVAFPLYYGIQHFVVLSFRGYNKARTENQSLGTLLIPLDIIPFQRNIKLVHTFHFNGSEKITESKPAVTIYFDLFPANNNSYLYETTFANPSQALKRPFSSAPSQIDPSLQGNPNFYLLFAKQYTFYFNNKNAFHSKSKKTKELTEDVIRSAFNDLFEVPPKESTKSGPESIDAILNIAHSNIVEVKFTEIADQAYPKAQCRERKINYHFDFEY